MVSKELFHRFPPEYLKLHLNKSNLGQGTINLCEWFEWKLNFWFKGA